MSAVLSIPRFVTPKPAPHSPPARLVAAVRWDFEYGLLSMAQCIERYSTLLADSTVRDICAGRIYPDVEASRFNLLWR